jgi:uncharacterized protein YaaN involved in tellurite resistance
MELLMDDPVNIIYKIQRSIKASIESLNDAILSGSVDNMEKYKYLLGQAHALQLMQQDISNLLQDKEQTDEQPDNTNVIGVDFSGSPED